MNLDHLNPSRFQVVKGNRGSNRSDIIDRFRSRLNSYRAAEGFAALSYPRMAALLQHVETDDLHAFYKDCEQAKCGFSRAFWGRLKTR